jgi:hypothetical protein
MKSRKMVKEDLYSGHQTCPVKGLDLSDGASDRTCPVGTGLVW